MSEEIRRPNLTGKKPLLKGIFDFFEALLAVNNSKTPFNDKVEVIRDVVYKTTEDGQEIVMDIYLPITKLPGKTPVVFDIPGGGWCIHNRQRRGGYAALYAKLGALVCVIDHRLVPNVFFPQNLEDCIDGLNFIETLKEKYDLDMDNITITGDSSGGHLSSLCGVASSVPDYCKKLGIHELKVKIARCIFISGAFSVKTMYRTPCTHTLMVRWATNTKTRSDFRKWEFAKEYDPYNYITESYPPSYNAGGCLDLLCIGEAKNMAEVLTSKGVDNEYNVGYSCSADHCYVFKLATKSCRKDMAKLIKWYFEQEKKAGVDMSEGYKDVEYFFNNYKEALKGKTFTKTKKKDYYIDQSK